MYVRNRTLRYYLCRTIFGRWLEYTKEQLWERDADAVCVMFEERKLCRFVFRTWRSTCMLLNWSSEWTEAKCANASRYFLGMFQFNCVIRYIFFMFLCMLLQVGWCNIGEE